MAKTKIKEILDEREKLLIDNFSVFKKPAMDLSIDEVFLYQNKLWIVTKEKQGFIKARQLDRKSIKIKFTWMFNPEVIEIYSSSF